MFFQNDAQQTIMYKKNFQINGADTDFAKEFCRYFMINDFLNRQNLWYSMAGKTKMKPTVL